VFLAGECALDRRARDRGDPTNKQDLREFQRGLSQLRRAILRQQRAQRKPGYSGSVRARVFTARYGTAYLVRGRPGADWRLSMKEAGEQNGRLHGHVASDFDFIHHGWLSDVARGYGLGFVQYSRKESAELRRAAHAAGARVRGAVIARYLASYLGKGDAPERPFPFPAHTRLLNAARGVLPKFERAADCCVTFFSVAEVAVDRLGALWVDADASFFSVKSAQPSQLQPGFSSSWG
jgi:hypothetical protein